MQKVILASILNIPDFESSTGKWSTKVAQRVAEANTTQSLNQAVTDVVYRATKM